MTTAQSAAKPLTLDELRKDPQVVAYINQANENRKAIGYTEHGTRHAALVAKIGRDVLASLGLPERTVELAAIAGFLHDIGNVIHRENHALSSAQMASDILARLGMSYAEIALVVNAIGNHEEERGVPTNPVSAALVIADKSDVHRSRVHTKDPAAFDVYDRVNHACARSFVRVDTSSKVITLDLTVDLKTATVMECFETFLSRMAMCRRAAEVLGARFELVINEQKVA